MTKEYVVRVYPAAVPACGLLAYVAVAVLSETCYSCDELFAQSESSVLQCCLDRGHVGGGS